MAKFWCKETRIFCRLKVGIIEPVFALLLFRPTIHKSSCEMLPLTALCAYSQYEAVEARLGDPGRLPRGGGCKAPSARTNKKPCLSPFLLYSHKRRDEARHLLVCQLQGTDSFRRGDSNYSPFNSQPVCVYLDVHK